MHLAFSSRGALPVGFGFVAAANPNCSCEAIPYSCRPKTSWPSTIWALIVVLSCRARYAGSFASPDLEQITGVFGKESSVRSPPGGARAGMRRRWGVLWRTMPWSSGEGGEAREELIYEDAVRYRFRGTGGAAYGGALCG